MEVRQQDTSVEQRKRRKGEESHCCNCDRKFTKDCLPTRQFFYEFYENGALVKKHVLIRDAIKEICQWRLFGLAEENEIEETFGSVQIRVCGSVCGIAIAKLYGAIKVFDSLAHASSELHFLTKKMLDSFMTFANQCITGEPVDKTKLPPNLLSNKRGRKEDNGIGSHILNRPLTQHLKLEKGEGNKGGGGEQEIRIIPNLTPSSEYPPGTTESQNSKAGELEKENRDDGDCSYNSGGEYGENEGNEDSEEEDEQEIKEEPKPTVIKPFLCQLCGAGLTSRQGLRTHELLTHEIGNKEKVFVCEHCGKEFFFDYLLKNHLTKHILTRDYPCPSCDLKFKGKRCLYQHQRDVHAVLENRFICNLCPGKSFKHKRTLWDHKKSIHGYGQKGKRIIFSCKFGCGSTSNRHRSMLSHYRRCLKRPIEVRREMEMDLAVESIGGVLGKVTREEDFGTIDDFNGGKREKIFSCTWDCGKTFTCKAYREKHVKRVCKKRPNQKHPMVRVRQNRRLNPVTPKTSRRVAEDEEVKVCSGKSPEEKDKETGPGIPEPIEVETVFDEIPGMML